MSSSGSAAIFATHDRGRLCERRVLRHRAEGVHGARCERDLDLGDRPDGTNINVGCGATDLRLLQETVRAHGCHLGVAFDGDGDRMLAVDERGETVDGDAIIAVLALDLGVELVAVTQMTTWASTA